MAGLTRGAGVTVALAALVLAGCSLPGVGGGSPTSSAPAPSEPPASAPTGAPATTAPAGQPTPADPSASSGAAPLGEAFTTRTSAMGGVKVTLQLYPLQRDGSVSHLNLTLSAPATGTEGQVTQLLSDSNPKAGDSESDAADGIQVVDGKNSKLYLVASDGNGTCLCSRNLGRTFLTDDLPVLVTATFAAPPADVSTVDVVVPSFGTVKGVPVQ
jgi:hypothetical protein